MRYISITKAIKDISSTVKMALKKKHKKLAGGDEATRLRIIDRGNSTWSGVKSKLEKASNRKCWYTESKNPGCVNDVDHFRPKAKKTDSLGHVEYWYWFLAFDAKNYRLSCQFANRPNRNPILNDVGGKHHHFPLVKNKHRAKNKTGILKEAPIILDPCNKTDCDMLQFQPDGRPVVAHSHRRSKVACLRVKKTNLLLNLDYPTFNEDREQLYNKVKKMVERGDNYGPGPARSDIQNDLRGLMHPDSQYSKAAECYVRFFRDRKWVEEILP